jgi:hypothetical protein
MQIIILPDHVEIDSKPYNFFAIPEEIEEKLPINIQRQIDNQAEEYLMETEYSGCRDCRLY